MKSSTIIGIKRALPQSFFCFDNSTVNNQYECNRPANEAYERFFHFFAKALGKRLSPTPQLDRSLWEAVIAIKKQHTLQDIEQLACKLNEKYGWHEVQISIHRSTDHIHQEIGQEDFSVHAHIIFFLDNPFLLYDFIFRRLSPDTMTELQTFVANILGLKVKKANKHPSLKEKYYALKQEMHRHKAEAAMFEKATKDLREEMLMLQEEIADLLDEIEQP